MKVRYILLILGLLLLVAVTPCYAQETQAWIIAFEGDVSVMMRDSTERIPASAASTLNVDDVVRTGENSKATLLLDNGKHIELGAEEEYTIEADPTPSPSWLQEVLASLFKRERPRNPGYVRSPQSDPPVLIYPRYGKLLSPRPTFVWLSALPRTATYEISLSDEQGDEVWTQTVSDTTLHYPDAAEPLKEGQLYELTVKSVTSGSGLTDSGSFTVATAAERKAVEEVWNETQREYASADSNDVTLYVIYAGYLFENAYYTDALLVLKRAEAKQPNSPAVKQLYALIYEWAGPPLLIPQ